MYIGRFLVVAPGVGGYRVSSRSFPNRRIVERDDALTVAPTPDAPPTDNPYVSYNCVRIVDTPASDRTAVVGNGSHVDPVAEKMELGYPARDALASSLLALDFEKDDYDTPRIAGAVGVAAATIGIVRRDALLVQSVTEPTLVATYERDSPEPYTLATGDDGSPDPDAVATELLDATYEHPVCAASVVVDDDGVAVGVDNGN